MSTFTCHIIVAALCVVLSACAPAVKVAPPDRATSPVPQAVFIGRNIDMRAQARNFVDVVSVVEPVAEAECRRLAPTRNCDFRIVVDDRPGQPPNAFQAQDDNGRPLIALTLSLIAGVENGDELAFILSHEAAHHIAGHLDRQRQAATVGATVFGQIAGSLGGSTPDSIRTAQQIGAAVAARTYSRDFELEADALGTVIAIQAGFDPLLGSAFFARIPDPGNRFLGTHPPNTERLDIVRQTAARLGFTSAS